VLVALQPDALARFFVGSRDSLLVMGVHTRILPVPLQKAVSIMDSSCMSYSALVDGINGPQDLVVSAPNSAANSATSSPAKPTTV
jgi:hypothetical protein